jgi:UDP-N-acetyl-D-glucosamine dehydrogenase
MKHDIALIRKIQSRKAQVGIVGLGYVGLPLLLEFSAAGFPALGFDIDEKKIKALKLGRSYIRHLAADRIKKAFVAGQAKRKGPLADATTDFSRISDCDAVLICVPTPLTHHREPDMTYIENTATAIAPYVRRGQLISLESTTYPGTTEELMIPILEAGCRLKAGRDFMVAFSPEREDPTTRTIRPPQFRRSSEDWTSRRLTPRVPCTDR